MKEPTLADMLQGFWRARLFMAVGALAGLVCAGLIVMTAVPHYKATMLVGAPERLNVHDGQTDVPPYSMMYQMTWPTQGHAALFSDFVRFETIVRGATVAALLLQDEVIREQVARDRRFVFEPGGRDVLKNEATFAAYLERHLNVEPGG